MQLELDTNDLQAIVNLIENACDTLIEFDSEGENAPALEAWIGRLECIDEEYNCMDLIERYRRIAHAMVSEEE